MCTYLFVSFLVIFTIFNKESFSQDSGRPSQETVSRKTKALYMGTLNPNAPRELANFSFLVGSWKCVVSILQPDGTRVNLNAEWTGQYILDGYAIADKYTMHDPEGKLLVCGMNFRSYNLKKNDWNMKWFEA